MQLGHILGHRHQLRNRLKRLSEIILIKAGYNNTLTLPSQRLANIHQFEVEKLGLVDPNNVGIVGKEEDLRGGVYCSRRKHVFIVGDNFIHGKPQVDRRLENLDVLPRDARALQPPDELFGLPAEHRTAVDLDPSGGSRSIKNFWFHQLIGCGGWAVRVWWRMWDALDIVIYSRAVNN